MVTRLSTLVSLLGALVLSLSAGCVDPSSRFDEFSNRVVDAAVVEIPDAPVLADIPDITGSFLVTAEPSSNPGSYMYFQATNVLTKDEGAGTTTLHADFQPLTFTDLTPVGDPLTISPEQAPVAPTGEFEMQITGSVPGSANPVGGIDIVIELDGYFRIVDEDTYCGYLMGGVTAPLQVNLDNSTVGGVRIPDGSTPADVDPLWNCPAGGDGDGDGDGD